MGLDLRLRKKKVRLARWQALTVLAQCCGDAVGLQKQRLVSYEGLQSILRLASQERFVSTEILYAIAEFVVVLTLQSHPDHANLLTVKLPAEDGDFSYLALIKQMYVTLDDISIRQHLVDVLLKLLESKEHVKATIRSGVVRAMLQVAIDYSENATAASLDSLLDQEDGSESQEQDCLRDNRMLDCAKVLTHMSTFVCFDDTAASSASLQRAVIADHSSEQFVCELVVQLMLSGVSLVFEEAIRLLQMLIENANLHPLLVGIMDLRGALEKAHTLAQQKESKLRAQDPYLVVLCEQQYQQLRPEIDAYERIHGSLVGLPADPDHPFRESGPASALTLATGCKERGNWFFKRGNFPTARAFYRRAVSILRMAQVQQDRELATLTKEEVLKQCSVGASVQVMALPRREWRNALVSDVDGGQIEVIYDDDDSEEVVDPSRVKLRMNTNILDAYENLEVDCCMNMGKAFSQLCDYKRAVESFTHVLKVKNHHHVAALYHRGIAYMALHDLKNAQQDLWHANQICRKLKDEKALLKQIVAAYKKLQQLHANKKKMDKKIIKQMMKYLSTIPGIQED